MDLFLVICFQTKTYSAVDRKTRIVKKSATNFISCVFTLTAIFTSRLFMTKDKAKDEWSSQY